MTDIPWYPFFSVMSFVWGACIGSFLNVCIYRIPRELSVVAPRSYCPHCNKMIPGYHNIPLLSYILLRARCANCGGRIVARYVLVELLVAILFLLVWLKYTLVAGPRPLGLVPMHSVALVPVYWLMISGLVLGTFVDFEHLIIPDRVTLGGIVAGLALSTLLPVMHDQTVWYTGLALSAIGAATGWGILWLIAVVGRMIFRKDAMGFGDVKLMGAIGAFLGWKAVLFTLLVSSLAGSVVGIALVLTGQRKMQSRIPYGPYIALAAALWILWGASWWQAYFNFFLPPIGP